jgi:hypothetical protein
LSLYYTTTTVTGPLAIHILYFASWSCGSPRRSYASSSSKLSLLLPPSGASAPRIHGNKRRRRDHGDSAEQTGRNGAVVGDHARSSSMVALPPVVSSSHCFSERSGGRKDLVRNNGRSKKRHNFLSVMPSDPLVVAPTL